MDSRVSQEVPKSPVKTWPTQFTYCTWTGLSSPKCASSAARCSGLAPAEAPMVLLRRASTTDPGTSRT